MAFAATWDVIGTHKFERGLDRGVIYKADSNGLYSTGGEAWSGLTSVEFSQDNRSFSPVYYDGYKISDVFGKGHYSGSISAFTYPDAMVYAEGGDVASNNILVTGQNFTRFALSFRTQNLTDLNETTGYKIHILYNLVAQRTSSNFVTINDSAEASEFTWDFSSTPAYAGATLIPTSYLIVDTKTVNASIVTQIENLLYGIATLTTPSLPTISALLALTP